MTPRKITSTASTVGPSSISRAPSSSTVTPTSSRSSRKAASERDSAVSTLPPGRHQKGSWSGLAWRTQRICASRSRATRALMRGVRVGDLVPKASQPRRWRGCDGRRGAEGGEKNELDAARALRGACQPRGPLALGAGLGLWCACEQEVERRHGGGGRGSCVGLFHSHIPTLAEDLRFVQTKTSKYSVKRR